MARERVTPDSLNMTRIIMWAKHNAGSFTLQCDGGGMWELTIEVPMRKNVRSLRIVFNAKRKDLSGLVREGADCLRGLEDRRLRAAKQRATAMGERVDS